MLAESMPGSSPFAMPMFRRLWAGWTLTALAIQFYAVALVWLVLDLTGSGVNLGVVLVAAAVPRAAAMLISGALIDRAAPRAVMLAAGLTSASILGLLALLLRLELLPFVLLLGLSALQGLTDAFFYPTSMAQMARLVAPAQLPRANALFQSSDAIANIIGPGLGGFVVGQIGLVPAFAVNSALFALGAVIIWGLRGQGTDAPGAEKYSSFGAAILAGMRYAWGQPAVRASLLMVALLNFAVLGPTVVGGALLVERRFGGDATQYGLMLAGYGVGALLGGLGAGWLPPIRRPGIFLAALLLGLGAGLALTGLAPAFWMVFALQAAMGVAIGVVSVVAISWLQGRTSEAMQGRMASLLLFAAVALDPFSNALSGALSEWSLSGLFLAAGGLMVVGGLLALLSPGVRSAD